jgi:hypothetical protein
LAALPLRVVGPVQLLMPDGLSEQLKLAVTSVLFQPLPLAAGVRLPVIAGALLSTLTVTEPLPVLPTRSVAVAVLVTPLVFAICESVAGDGTPFTPEPLSVADQVTPTLELFHPAALGAGLSAAVTSGPVLSRMNDAFCVPDVPVHLLFALKLGDAAAVTVGTPSPVPAVKPKVHDDFAVDDCWWPLKSPVTSTHFVSVEVVTVSVNAWPFLAYSVPLVLVNVPGPPVNAAVMTVEL